MSARKRTQVLAILAALVAVVGAAVVITNDGDGLDEVVARLEAEAGGEAAVVGDKPRLTVPASTTTTTATTTTTTTTAPATTAAPPPPDPTTTTAAAPAGSRYTVEPYRGLGAWLDVYDWSTAYGGPRGGPTVGLADLDRMAALGVQTIFIQASKHDYGPDALVEPARLLEMVDRAHALGMHVVAWYLPSLVAPEVDLERMLEMTRMPFDGLGLDIEPTSTPEAQAIPYEERNARLLWISHRLRELLPGEVLSAIPVPPVVFEINPNYWPGYPWAELGALYDVWQPMTYWTFRTQASGWRNAYTYIGANIDRLRQLIGRPDALVHPIGGVHGEGPAESEHLTAADVAGMVQASSERGAIGGSLYDYVTTHDELWGPLQGFNG